MSPDTPSDLSPTSTGPQQKRKRHKNSRAGCLTCKTRHVKCDEQRPKCTPCSRGSRPCRWDIPALKVIQVSYTDGKSSAVDVNTKTSLDFFKECTIPMLKRLEPSPVWDDIVTLIASDTCLLRVASALGHQHQTLHSPDQDSVLYARAVSTWRASVGQGSAAATCLLFVLLSALRGSTSEMCLHLKFGVEHIYEAGLPAAWRIYLRPLQKLCLGVVLFNPLAAGAVQMLEIARTAFTTHRGSSDAPLMDELEDLTMQIIVKMQSMQTGGPLLARAFPDLEDVAEIKRRHHILDQAIDLEMLKGNIHYRLAKSGMLLQRVYLEHVWMAHQTAFDASLEVFRQIVQIQADVLKQMQPHGFPTFSLGTGSLLILWNTVMLCRDGDVRRAALDTIDMCPSQDGAWRRSVVKEICQAVIKFEEEQASKEYGFELCRFIPEHCRVQHYLLVESEEDQKSWKSLRVFLRPNSAEHKHVAVDIPLGGG